MEFVTNIVKKKVLGHRIRKIRHKNRIHVLLKSVHLTFYYCDLKDCVKVASVRIR